MKKIFFLMLMLLIGALASMNAQVRIGGLEDPHQSAVLDLNANDTENSGHLGLALPRVSLSGSNAQLNSVNAVTGTVVYNTGTNIGEQGLYVWNGSSWTIIKACTLPAVPEKIAFSPVLPATINVKTIVSAGITPVVGATSYTWTFPAGLEIQGAANGNSISLRATQAGTTIDCSNITVKVNNECGSSPVRAGLGTLTVQAPTAAPAMPTFSIARHTINVGGTTIIGCSDVGADTYNWTLPSGITGTSPTTTNSIVITGTTANTYAANQFKVSATNSKGTSATRTASGEAISVGNCTSAPVVNLMPDCTSKRSVGAQFTLAATVTTVGNTSYEWTVPAGLAIVSGGSAQTVTVECKSIGSYDGNNITVKVSNDCGSVIARASGTIRVLVDGQPGPDITGKNGTYHTYIFPEDIGTWMITNSKEGTPSAKQFPGHEEGERGYYYDYEATVNSSCPDGWSIGSVEQGRLLVEYIGGRNSTSDAIQRWVEFGYAGYWAPNVDWAGWGFESTVRIENHTVLWVNGANLATRYMNNAEFDSYLFPIRCIKNSD